MARVSVDVDFLTDLIDFKLKYLKEEIERILKKWNYTSLTAFLGHSKDGTLSEAEEDAIILTNLIDQRESLLQKKTSWNKD